MPHRASAAVLAVIFSLALAACSGAASSPSSAEASPPSVAPASSEAAEPSEEPSASEDAGGAEEVRVRIDNSNFDPAELTVAVGTEVTWVNADTFAHTVTEGTDGQAADDPVVDEEIDQGGAVSFTFDEPGTYEITCRIHPSMNMTITVEG